MLAIFTYGFTLAEDNFKKAQCHLTTLSNYNDLVDMALESGYIDEDHLETLKTWRKDPGNWSGGKDS
jgi:orotate phosphoribosyltransferase